MVNEKNGHFHGCELSTEILDKINDMHSIVGTSHHLLNSIAAAQSTMAAAANSMANTNSVAEQRYAKLEDRLQEANDRASGKSQIPIISHLLILGTTVLVTLVLVLYATNRTIDATFTSLKVKQEGK